METGQFRHVSASALLLAACALLAAFVGAISVVVSEMDYSAVKANAANVLRIQGKRSGEEVVSSLQRPAALQMVANAAFPVERSTRSDSI